MIDPQFIFTIADGTEVTTPDGTEDNIHRIAAWSWTTTEDDETSLFSVNTSSSTVYIPVDGVKDIDNLTE